MKNNLFILLLSVIPAFISAQCNLTQSNDLTVLNGGIACRSGGFISDNSFFRAFDISSCGAPGSNFSVNDIALGIFSANSPTGTQPLTINLYTVPTGSFPGSFMIATQVGTANFNLANQTTPSLINFAVSSSPITIGALDLVVEVFNPDGVALGHSLALAINTLGETGPTYIASVGCNISTPVTMASLGFNDQLVLEVNPPTVSNDADINDPCACNLAGGLADGTFTETVTVEGNATGETWTVVSVASLNPGGTLPTGIAVTDVLTETPAGSAMYEITFDHSDLDGYELTVERSSDNRQLTISNVCATPVFAFDPAIPANNTEADATITLGANIMTGGAAAASSPTFSLDGTNDITQLDFDPTTDVTIGQVGIGNYTLTGHYETDGMGSGMGGTLAAPAVPTNACPVEATAAFMVSAPAPVPTLGQWGLIILALLLVNFAFVMLTAPKLTTTTGQEMSIFNLKNLPFDLNAYAKTWAATAVGILAIFTVAIQLFGYELTSADPIGALVSSFLVAYAFFTLKNEE